MYRDLPLRPLKNIDMLKLKHLLLLSVIIGLSFVMSSCSGGEKYELSDVAVDSEVGDLTVTVGSADSEGGTFTFANSGDRTFCYGDRNMLERYMDGAWHTVISYAQRTMTEPSYQLEGKSTLEYETSWDTLEEGEYRYVVPFWSVEEDLAERETYYIAAYFTI